ncbi:MAG: nucleotide sugar dehydrogenase [Thaumarchaeota archaeon]|nr:nucleotide sugar dehydrogenase [Nitrososphaerota archaeon]
MSSRHTVGMVGLGYVGLTTAAFFVSKGVRVVGVDVLKERVSSLSKGIVPIHEEGVEPLIRKGLKSRMISFHADYKSLDRCDIVFLTVGTPGLPGGAIDTRHVEAAAAAVGSRLKRMGAYPVIVVKSTVIPSTTVTKVLPVLERESELKCGEDFGLAMNPEFLREGKALWDMMHPDAVVVGRVDKRAVKIVSSLFRAVYREMPPFLVTDAVNAEFMKYGVNSIRAVQLSFINTLADMCARVDGAQIEEVMKGLLLVAQIDKRYSRAGLGFAGSCLPKDTKALLSLARSLGVNDTLLDSAVKVNESQADEAIAMAKDLIGSIEGKRIAVLGLTFKAETDDTRESVGIRLANKLSGMRADVAAFDPGYKAGTDHAQTFGLAKSVEDCLRSADCCIVTNEWDEFKKLTPRTFRRLMNTPAVVDGRGLYDIHEFSRERVRVRRIGVGPTRTRPNLTALGRA